MNKVELAQMLDGCDHMSRDLLELIKLAKQHELVIVYSILDDLMELRGAICDEFGCFNGGIAYLDDDGFYVNECIDDRCPYAAKKMAKCKTIEAVWYADNEPVWTYKTSIPHATFNVLKDGEVYCRGIVFELAALKTEEDEDG